VKGDIMKNIYDFQATYAGYGGKSYISFSVPAQEEIIEYQAEMLAKNRIDFLLPLSVQRLNNDWKLSFEITSKIPLAKVLERKSLKCEEFEYIIKQIGNITAKLRDYLLDVSSVVFDKSYIYCDPGDLSLYFMYFPVNNCGFDSNTLRDFLHRLIFEDIRLLDDSSGSLLKRLLDVLKSETFTPDQLLNCINQKLPEKRHCTNEQAANEGGATEEPQKDILDNYNAVGSGKFAGKEKRDAIPRPWAGYSENKVKKPVRNHRVSGMKYPLKSYLITGAVNIFLLCVLICILLSGISSDMTSTLSGLLLIGFASNYFVITRMFSKDKRKTVNTEPEKQVNVPSGRRFVNEAIKEDKVFPKRKPLHMENEVKGNGTSGFESVNRHEKAKPAGFELSSNDTAVGVAFTQGNRHMPGSRMVIQDKTIVLGFASVNEPFLQSHSCPSEKIKLTKDSTLFGRLSDSVDYAIRNMAVGKIHAEIVKKEDGYYVIDLNSVNGTYVNNERVTCNTEVKLKNGDIVTFANESYTFVV